MFLGGYMVFERLLLIGVLNMKNIKEYEKEFLFYLFFLLCSIVVVAQKKKYYGHNNGYCG